MIEDWIGACGQLAFEEPDFFSGARKILRGRQVVFNDLEDDLSIQDAGFTKSKLTILRKLYLHEESRDIALELWQRRLGQGKYGSVSFHCFGHLVKGGAIDAKRSKRASVMGPCLQSVCLTLTDKGRTHVDVFYRTTELYKKFPADLVFLRDTLLADFDLSTFDTMTCHFANVTVHPMYYVTIIPHQANPIRELDRLKLGDRRLYDWVVKWTARYLCDEYHRGIAKFAQAMRVCMDARARIPEKQQEKLRAYLIENHPGHRNEYKEEDDEE